MEFSQWNNSWLQQPEVFYQHVQPSKHLLDKSIQCAEQGNYTEIKRLRSLIQNPFQQQAGMQFYSLPESCD